MNPRSLWLKAIVAVFVTMFPIMGQRLEARTLNLIEVYRLAQLNDPKFLEAKAEYKAALQELPAARSKLLPQVSIDAGDNWSHAKTIFGGQPPVSRGVRSWNWSVQLDQPVLRLANDYAFYQSKHRVRQAFYKYQLEKEQLILRVAKAYFNVLKAKAAMRESCSEIQANQFQLKSAKKAVKSGLAATTDVYEAESHLGLSRYKFLSASNNDQNRSAQLAKIINRWPSGLTSLHDQTQILPPVPDKLAPWLNRANKRNYEVLQMNELSLSYVEGVKKARAGYYPTVDITASYGGNYSSGNQVNIINYSTNKSQWELGLEFKMPLDLNGGQGAKVAAAVYKQEGSIYKVEVAKRTAETQAREAFAGVRDELSKLQALKYSLQAAMNSVAGNRVGYRMGLRTNLNVLHSQAQLYKVKMDIVKTRYNALYHSLELKASAGNLGLKDLQALNALMTQLNPQITSCP